MEGEATRRNFLQKGAMATAGFVVAGSARGEPTEGNPAQDHATHGPDQVPRHDQPEAVGSPKDRGKLVPGVSQAGEPPPTVITPDLHEKLAWTMVDDAKEFHLHCRHTKREFLPDLDIDVWGLNGGMPGPTIEVAEGDRVRIVVHNELPESTGIHWHGLEIPVAMDGVPGLTQPPIPPGGSQAYEFTLRQNGTFFYHSHDGMQDGMGMVGLFIVHPRVAHEPRVDRDFALVIQEWAILPASTVPNTMSMEFNLFTLNGWAAPYITPVVCRLGERVRIRLVNFSGIDQHSMHLHGLTFWVTGTEGGRIPETAWMPGNVVLVGVAQVREIEFVANNPGDWMLHCHMFHHVMNFMSSMVGPMGGHTTQGMRVGGSMASGMGMLTQGTAFSPELGGTLGRGMGEQTGSDRAVGNMTVMPGMRMPAEGAGRGGMQGGHGGHGGLNSSGRRVPGYPQGMMDMPMEMPESKLRKITGKRETRGMRRDWYTGVEGLMTVVRVLPPDLYDRVMSGEGEVPAGSSTPGGGAGEATLHRHRN